MADDVKKAVIATHEAAEKTQAKVATAAEDIKDSAKKQEDSADRRTELAADRTVLAAERTYAAWMRTGLASLAAGIGSAKLLEGLTAPWLIALTSIALVLFSAFCFLAAVWREFDTGAPPPRPDVRKLPGWVMAGFSLFLAIVALAALVGVWSRAF